MKPGTLVWITGLPSSGKTVLGRAVADALQSRGRGALLLDGDDVRSALVPRPSHDEAGRAAFYETLTRLAVSFARQGTDVLVSATAHRRAVREAARAAAPGGFLEVHVVTPIDECRRRDDKGLYAAAARGDIEGLPGADLPYEPPLQPEVSAQGGRDPDAIRAILGRLGLGEPGHAPCSTLTSGRPS